MTFILVAFASIRPRPALAQDPTTNPATRPAPRTNAIFARDNIAAWCIVPYDGSERGPAERAQMLERIGLHHFVYDWRDKQIPGFPTELDELAKHHITLDGVWFPDQLDRNARFLLDTLRQHQVTTQLWVSSWAYDKVPPPERVAAAVERLRPIAVEADKIGCTLCLYNHNGWFGEWQNQLAVMTALHAAGFPGVRLVYNLHHAYDEIDRFDEIFPRLLPYLVAVNLNGMTKLPTGAKGEPVVPVGQGDLDIHLLRTIRDSGFNGPIGIINESNDDAEMRLLDNLDGIAWIVPQLDGKVVGARPRPRSWTGK